MRSTYLLRSSEEPRRTWASIIEARMASSGLNRRTSWGFRCGGIIDERQIDQMLPFPVPYTLHIPYCTKSTLLLVTPTGFDGPQMQVSGDTKALTRVDQHPSSIQHYHTIVILVLASARRIMSIQRLHELLIALPAVYLSHPYLSRRKQSHRISLSISIAPTNRTEWKPRSEL
jgi:hypothetical protein